MIKHLAAAVSSAVALFTIGIAPANSAPIGVTVLPQPGGQSPVGTTTLHLVDDSRPDPFQAAKPRELMVSVFYPASEVGKYPRAHYISNQLIPEVQKSLGIELPGLLTNSYTDAPVLGGAAYPVVLYSPGGGVTRLLGNGLAEDLASRGYIVVSIDHTYEAPAVEFPGGRIVRAAGFPEGITPAVRQQFIDARLLDTRFVLDSLAQLAGGTNPDAEHRALPAGLDRAIDLDHVGMVGHSSGGYTAVEAAHEDPRIDAAVDLDGQIGVDENFGRAVTEGITRPVLVMTSQQIEEVGDANPSLDAFWQRAPGWKRQLTLRDSAHYDYTDMPLLVPDAARTLAKTYLGPIPAARAATLIRTFVAAMFDKFLRDLPDTALDRTPGEPEITVLR